MFVFFLRIFPLFCCICTLFLGGCGPLAGPEKGLLPFRVYFLNVGQGDACLLRTPANRFYLYDIGNEPRYLIAFLRSVKVDTLEAVFVSHPDLDHYGSFPTLLHEFPIKKVYLPPGMSQNPAWLEVLHAIDASHKPTGTLLAGDTLLWDQDIRVRALWPYSRAVLQGNNLSLVLRVEYASHTVLLTGDVEEEGEIGMLASGTTLSSDILKVAHHGSRTSSGLPFLSAVAPHWAIISCDSTVYGHPHPETVADLNYVVGDSNRILRTDRVGTVGFEIDEYGVRRIETQRL